MGEVQCLARWWPRSQKEGLSGWTYEVGGMVHAGRRVAHPSGSGVSGEAGRGADRRWRRRSAGSKMGLGLAYVQWTSEGGPGLEGWVRKLAALSQAQAGCGGTGGGSRSKALSLGPVQAGGSCPWGS